MFFRVFGSHLGKGLALPLAEIHFDQAVFCLDLQVQLLGHGLCGALRALQWRAEHSINPATLADIPRRPARLPLPRFIELRVR